jgi:hypothetical protein
MTDQPLPPPVTEDGPPSATSGNQTVQATAGLAGSSAIAYTVIDLLNGLDEKWIRYVTGAVVFLVLIAFLFFYLRSGRRRTPSSVPQTFSSEADPFAALEAAINERRRHANVQLVIVAIILILSSPVLLNTYVGAFGWYIFVNVAGLLLFAGLLIFQYFQLRAELSDLDRQRVRIHVLFKTLQAVEGDHRERQDQPDVPFREDLIARRELRDKLREQILQLIK